MHAFVITMINNPDSVAAADRCIASGKKYGINVKKWTAFTPDDDPKAKAKEIGIPTAKFEEHWSRFDNCLSAFLSHYSLWTLSIVGKHSTLILEHDAVFEGPVPQVSFEGLISFGAPSYGRWNTPQLMGVNPLTSKRYLPGAHAYVVNPRGAQALVDYAQQGAAPTDVYLCLDNFPWLQEYYPWPIRADDSFTTIQNENGIRAKHNYQKDPKNFRII